MRNISLGIKSVLLCLAMIASVRSTTQIMTERSEDAIAPTKGVLSTVTERRENTTSRSRAFKEHKVEVTTRAAERSFPYRTTHHRKRHTMHTVRGMPQAAIQQRIAQEAKKDSVQDPTGYNVVMPQKMSTNDTLFKRTTREPQNVQTTEEPSENSTFVSVSPARLQLGKKHSTVCPEFCCYVNVSCHYTYDIHLKPKCGCADAGVFANDTKTCVVPDNTNQNWTPVMKRPPWAQGTCMGGLTKRDRDNATGLKFHCHIDQVEDFTYTVVHWNVTSPGGGFPFRPCVMFIYVNNTEPPHYVKTTVDIVIQYFGFGLIFLFIGVIMSSCKNIKA